MADNMPKVAISASDDLLTRAEKIVRFIGYRGAIGNHILNVHQLLKAYEDLDKQAFTPPPPETGSK